MCSDINDNMIDYAQRQFGHIKGLEFKVFDMWTETEELPNDPKGQFDHVLSCYALMYPKSQRYVIWLIYMYNYMLTIFSRKAIRNIFNLIKPERGDCPLVSLAYHPVFEAYAVLKQMEKWSQYMYDINLFISPQQYSEDSRREFTEFLLDAGFWEYSVEMYTIYFCYKGEGIQI